MQVFVCQTSQLPSGQHKILNHNGRKYVVCNFNSIFYAFEDKCPHLKARFTGRAFGMFFSHPGQDTVKCGAHGAVYDLTSGANIVLPKGSARTGNLPIYTVTDQSGQLYADLP